MLAKLPCDSCKYCIRHTEEWQEFQEHVDTIVAVSSRNSRASCQRVTTRSLSPTANIEQLQTWLSGHSHEEIRQLQQEDADLEIVQLWFGEDELPSRDRVDQYSPAVRSYYLNWDTLKRKNGVIYRKWYPDEEKKPVQIQLLVPKVLRQEVLQHCHNVMLGGHMGVAKTLGKLRSRFHWYGVSTDVKAHIQQCPVCTANSKPTKKYKAPLGQYRVGQALDLLGIDVLGPLILSGQQNKYVLVIGDYATRWIEVCALPDQKAETVAQTLVHEFISRFGCPLQIHSDQGRNFESYLFQEVCRLLQISKTRSTPFHPSANRLIERFNATLARMIRSFIDGNQRDWDLYLPLLTAAYRSTIHPATGYTPNMMMFGRAVHLPVDLLFPIPTMEIPENAVEYVTQLRARLEKCYHLLGNI